MENILLWKGGVKLFQIYPGAVFDPVEETWLTAQPPRGRPVRIVDVNPYSHATVHVAAQKLVSLGYEVAEILTVPYRPPEPMPSPLVVLAGLSCTGKSAIAHQLAMQNDGVYLKWARFVEDAGLYGERAAEKELVEPLVYAQHAYKAINSVPREVPVILDGVKDVRVMQFLGYATGRPIVPLFFKTDESIRLKCTRMRRDEDDAFDGKRRALFWDRLKVLESYSVVVDLMSADHRIARLLLEKNGLTVRLPVGDTLLSKYFLLDLIAYAARKPKDGDVPLLKPFHTRYSERYGLSGEAAELINLTASAFRVVDDILDGDVERRIVISGLEKRIPALWTEIGVWPAIYHAGEAISYIAARAPDSRAFAEMVIRVTNAVRIELRADEEGRRLTAKEYIATLERETAFRAWLAGLAGLSVEEAVRDAIRAQVKNDRYAAGLERKRLPANFKSISESILRSEEDVANVRS